MTTTFVLLHGSGDDGWAWHLVQRALGPFGHRSVAPDLPTDRADATWEDVVGDVVAAATESGSGATDFVVVGHSAGGLVAPLVAERLDARLVVHVAGLVPRPGERATAWLGGADWGSFDPDPLVTWYHDVDPVVAEQAMARERPTSAGLGDAPWPGTDVLARRSRYVVTTRDRFLPPALQRRAAAERLGLDAPDEIASGHCAPLSRPQELAALLDRIAADR